MGKKNTFVSALIFYVQGASVRVDALLGALITESVETCKNAKSDGTQVVIPVPDEWDEQKTNNFSRIFEQVSKLEVVRTLKRSTAAWLGFVQNNDIDEIENQKNSEPQRILVIRIGGTTSTGTTSCCPRQWFTKLQR